MRSKGDVYVHADLHGAATTIIKNNYYNAPAPATPMSAANAMFGRN